MHRDRENQGRLQKVLREVRQAAGFRQSDLAARLGVPQSFVSKYESGERRLDLIEIEKICKATGISLSDFVRKYEDPSQ